MKSSSIYLPPTYEVIYYMAELLRLGQFRDTGNIRYKIQKEDKQNEKHNTEN